MTDVDSDVNGVCDGCRSRSNRSSMGCVGGQIAKWGCFTSADGAVVEANCGDHYGLSEKCSHFLCC